MKGNSPLLRGYRACFVIASLAALLPGMPPASAATAPELFPLGQSGASGAVCQAARAYDDPAAQIRYAKAWTITCRGWSGVPLGYVYTFVANDPSVIGPGSPWQNALRARAACGNPQPANVPELPGATRAACESAAGKVPYSLYQATTGNVIAISEGMSALSDLLEVALKVASGTAPAPASAVQLQTSAQLSENADANLAAAAEAVQRSPAYLQERAYAQNQGWNFDGAERDFRLLATADNVSATDRTYAQLNWALNVSNQGRFADADRIFAEAELSARMVNDPQLDALQLNYHALNFLNQRKFAEAENAAKQAIALRARIDPSTESGPAAPGLVVSNRGLEITPSLSASLNRRENATGFQVAILTPAERMFMQNAQGFYVIGAAHLGIQDLDGARENFERADKLLTNPRLASASAWLRARVYDELSKLDLNAGRLDQARARLVDAVRIFQLRRDLAASPAEAGLYMTLGRIEAEAKNIEPALVDYATGFELFRQSRGTVGDSADATKTYFDLLIARSAAEPARAREFQSRFFSALQSIVSQESAQTIARLAARFSQGGSGAGAARALEDTQRQIAIKSSEIQRQQESGAYPAQNREADTAELKALSDQLQALQQQLLQANPRYGQLLATAAALDDMQMALRPGELYVKTIILGQAGYGIAISSQQVRIYSFPLTQVQANQAAAAVRRPFDVTGNVPRFDVAAARNLYRVLFTPVQDLMANARHLIYDPDGTLVSLPAAIFVTDDASVTRFNERLAQFRMGRYDLDLYENVAWLGRNTAVTLTVSPSAFLQARAFQPSRAPYPFLGVGDPVIDNKADPRLFRLVADPASGSNTPACEQARIAMANGLANTGMAQMIRTVGAKLGARAEDVMLGQAFTDTAMLNREDLGNYKVVFFGTHGLLPTKGDCLPEPALVTSLGTGESDSLLDASEILKLKLDADLVVLAACDTGGAGSTTADRTGLAGSGEALGGLARDFIYAGSRGLVVSQWAVDRDATIALMSALFGGGAESQGDAFLRAQNALMNDKKYSHPYYWAAFSLLGDGMRAMPGS
ncbi:MAG TPA: CHAT domain-containing protein [Micropepsaceae bacterium]|nr:CHAT domain-containing protein [Micropepsaceae bacterium]